MAPAVANAARIDVDALTRVALDQLDQLITDQPGLEPTDQRRHMVRWVNALMDRVDITDVDKRTEIAATVISQCFRSTKLLDVWRFIYHATRSFYPIALNNLLLDC